METHLKEKSKTVNDDFTQHSTYICIYVANKSEKSREQMASINIFKWQQHGDGHSDLNNCVKVLK